MWKSLQILFSPITKLFDWLKSFIIGWWAWVLSIFVFILVPINFILDIILNFLSYLNTQLITMTTSVTSFWAYLDTTYSSVATVLAIANALFPLSTLFSILTLLFSVWIVGLLYRAIKSYVPTLS